MELHVLNQKEELFALKDQRVNITDFVTHLFYLKCSVLQ